MDFADLFRSVNAVNLPVGHVIPNGYNGELGEVDLSMPGDFVGAVGKIVMTAANQYDLHSNLKYQLWVTQGCPVQAADAAVADDMAVTEEHFRAYWPRFCNVVNRYKVYSVLHEAGHAPAFRQNDVVNAIANRPQADEFVAKLYRHMTQSVAVQLTVAQSACHLLHSFVANSIHRKQNADHSWFTNATMNSNSLTGKTLSVAGIDRDAFRDYMLIHGHDANHHLTSQSIEDIAGVLTGHIVAQVPLAQPGAAPVNYGGRNIRGQNVHDVFTLSQAAKDRWPPADLGKAALLVGLDMIGAMITDMATKVKLTNAAVMATKAADIAVTLRRHEVTRAQFTAAEAAMGDMLAFTCGYVLKARLIEEGSYPAFESHANRYPAGKARGMSVASAVKLCRAHDEAVAGAIVSALGALGTALDATGGSVALPAPGGIPGLNDVPFSALGPVQGAQVRAQVGEDPTIRMMAAMAGNVFHNANT